MTSHFSRRTLLAGSVIAAAGQLSSKARGAESTGAVHRVPALVQPRLTDHAYEVNYTESEWRARLSNAEFKILREGSTEAKKSNPLWKEKSDGFYKCRGCDLGVYSSHYKVILNKGWLFFKNSEPDSVLMGNDLVTEYGSSRQKPSKTKTFIEAHCRRCGSHFGHILYIKGQILHCVNGTSLVFTPSA